MARNDRPMGIYCRLSRDKKDEGNYSISIENQEGIIRKYASDNPDKSITLTDSVYVDDGYTGMSYDRPAFERMMEDCRIGKIGGIIVKDLSRLGRKQSTTLELVRETFLRDKIRFISIQEGYDNADPSNSGISILLSAVGMMNEVHCETTSQKTKEALRTLASEGKFIGSKAPFGYTINPENKYHLIVDTEAAEVVQRIFSMACEGKGFKSIAGTLRREGILNPTAYVNFKNPKHHANSEYWSKPHDWHTESIRTILNNPAYMGHIFYGRRGKMSWLVDKIERKSEDNWIKVFNTHEPIITQDTWDLAHEILSRRTKSCHDNKPKQIFAGLLKCSDCGYSLAFTKGNKDKLNDNGSYKCSTYNVKGKDYCSIHYISYNDLYAVVLGEIQEKAKLAVSNRDWFMQELQKSANSQGASKAKGNKARLGQIDKELAKQEKRINTLYDDREDGTITKERFKKMLEDTEERISALEQEREGIVSSLTKTEEATTNITNYLDLVSEYADIQELDQGILNRLIERITVGNKVSLGGNRYAQDINIQFRFVGAVAVTR